MTIAVAPHQVCAPTPSLRSRRQLPIASETAAQRGRPSAPLSKPRHKQTFPARACSVRLTLATPCAASACYVWGVHASGPCQVYGPRDTLFMPNMMETAATGKLRVFGRALCGVLKQMEAQTPLESPVALLTSMV